ncbi:sunset domain-containing protein [Mesobacillus foraminis]|uniref:sunset domain-containing protein n=1 Tax=Mesobacillus foraminis TaxID=279826 RepID=UPI000EF454D8|nr:hypothetical protein [Mesobacillus foraminis]
MNRVFFSITLLMLLLTGCSNMTSDVEGYEDMEYDQYDEIDGEEDYYESLDETYDVREQAEYDQEMADEAEAQEYSDELYEQSLEDERQAQAEADQAYQEYLQGESCDIKGNISFNTGERIYHMPGDPYYDETKIDENYGEQWFCSPSEAEAAGFRRNYN